MPCPKNRYKVAAASARTGKSQQLNDALNSNSKQSDCGSSNDNEVTKWTGSVNYIFSDQESESEEGSEEEWAKELKGQELAESLQIMVEMRIEELELASHTPYEEIIHSKSRQDWKRAESKRSLGYNGHSEWTKQHHNQQARLKVKTDLQLQKT